MNKIYKNFEEWFKNQADHVDIIDIEMGYLWAHEAWNARQAEIYSKDAIIAEKQTEINKLKERIDELEERTLSNRELY